MRKFILSAILAMVAITFAHGQGKGYKGMVDAGWILVSEKVAFQATTIHGWQFNPYLFVGGGAGVNYYSNKKSGGDGASGVLIPVFADVRGYVIPKKISPYGEVKIGASIPITDWFSTSPYVAPALGCRFGLSSDWAIDVAVEYVLQKKMRNTVGNGEISNGGLCLKLGVEF